MASRVSGKSVIAAIWAGGADNDLINGGGEHDSIAGEDDTY